MNFLSLLREILERFTLDTKLCKKGFISKESGTQGKTRFLATPALLLS